MSAPRTDHTHVLLLRGVNVGRANRVSRDALIRWTERAGAVDVTTLLASGNVLFRLPHGAPERAAAAVLERFREAARAEGGLDVPVLLTTPDELRAALALHDGLPWAGGEPRLTQLMLLADEPDADAEGRLEALDHGAGRPQGPDRTALAGRFLWLRCPAGISASALTPARLERALGVAGTARNLAVVRTLAAAG